MKYIFLILPSFIKHDIFAIIILLFYYYSIIILFCAIILFLHSIYSMSMLFSKIFLFYEIFLRIKIYFRVYVSFGLNWWRDFKLNPMLSRNRNTRPSWTLPNQILYAAQAQRHIHGLIWHWTPRLADFKSIFRSFVQWCEFDDGFRFSLWKWVSETLTLTMPCVELHSKFY